jgi:hypothetical protein
MKQSVKSYFRKILDLTLGKYLDSWVIRKQDDWRMAIGDAGINSSLSAQHKFRYLWDSEVRVFSQNGEDGILNYICETLNLQKPSMIEIGAGNFTECNSRYLAEHRCANVLAVDAQRDLESVAKKLLIAAKTNIQILNTWVTTQNVNEIIDLGKSNFGSVDIFSLDLDGNDYWILNSANLEGIKVIIVEFNPLLSQKTPVSVPMDETFDRSAKHYSWTYYGANLYAFEYLLKSRGFEFIGTSRHGSNAFFVESSYRSKFDHLEIDLEISSDVRARENRGLDGKLTFVSGRNRVSLIEDQVVIDVREGKQVLIGECWNW